MDVSFDEGASWQPAQQVRANNDPFLDADLLSYKADVPEGATTVRVRGTDADPSNPLRRWAAQNFHVVSRAAPTDLGGSQTPAPTTTVPATTVPATTVPATTAVPATTVPATTAPAPAPPTSQASATAPATPPPTGAPPTTGHDHTGGTASTTTAAPGGPTTTVPTFCQIPGRPATAAA
jgi:hypothetical protein